MSKVRVSEDVMRGLDAVRESGLTNMLARDTVARLAREWGFEATARWIETHHKQYAEGLFAGFAVKEAD